MHKGWEGIDFLHTSDAGGGYEWWECALVARTLDDGRREYACYEDSGCSCNYPFEDEPEFYDLAWTTNIREALDRATRGIRDISSNYITAQERISALVSLNVAVMKERKLHP